MFPAGLLESVSVAKSYTADRSAEFAGGLVEIVPSRLQSGRSASFSYSFGGNSLSWGNDVLDHVAGGRDWLGLPNDSRRLPDAFPDRRVVRGGIFTPEVGVVGSQLEALGEMLVNEWSPALERGAPHQGFSGSFGDRWGKFGLSASANHSYKSAFRAEDQVYYSVGDNDELVPFSTYDYRAGENRAMFSTLVNAGYAFSSSHRLSFQSFTTDKGMRETRTFEGYNDDIARNIRNARLLWQEENLRSFQVSGDHLIGRMAGSRLDWRASYSRSNHDEPDIREVLYQELPTVGYVLADESQSGLRMFNDLDEDAWDVSASWNLLFSGVNGLPTSIKIGPAFSHRERDFASRRFRFVPINVIRFDLTRPAEELFTPANIGSVFELREETRATDAYAAEQTVGAGFGQVDVALSARARLIAGARVEAYRQRVDTFDLFGLDLALEGEADPTELIRAEIEQTDVFPAVNFVYDLGGGRNLRLGFSQTVNRPDFRELAPFEFTDIVGGRAVVGNPDLERSLIRNVDVRWEWFPGAREVVAASFFFKSFDRPIERFIEPTAQLRTSFTNARSARNYGLELEARREVGGGFVVGGNYTFIDSNIELEPFQTNVLTSLERPLSGTSRHLFNAMIEANVAPVSVRFLTNAFSDRIVDVGALGLPDILEEGRPTVDVVVSARLGRMFTVRVAGENLGNRPIRFVQGGQIHREFEYGRTFAVQFSITDR
jgi:outer membrane receptor protein involved in Fe transport